MITFVQHMLTRYCTKLVTNTVKHCGLHSWLGTKWPRAVCLRASHCVTLYFVVCLLERLALSHFLLSIVLTSWLDYWQLSSSNVVECTHRQEGKGLLILHCWQLQVALLPLLPTLPPAQDGAFVPRHLHLDCFAKSPAAIVSAAVPVKLCHRHLNLQLPPKSTHAVAMQSHCQETPLSNQHLSLSVRHRITPEMAFYVR